MTEELRARRQTGSENHLARLMRAHALRAPPAPRYVPCTTDRDHDEPVAPNRLAAADAPDRPNPIWLEDITYVRTGVGGLYLARVLDLWSRQIVGWALANPLRAERVISALRMAQMHRQPGNNGGLVHSHRGVPYACAPRKFSPDWKMTRWMSRGWTVMGMV